MRKPRAATLAAKASGKAAGLKPAAKSIVVRKGRNATLVAKKATTPVRKKVPIHKKCFKRKCILAIITIRFIIFMKYRIIG